MSEQPVEAQLCSAPAPLELRGDCNHRDGFGDGLTDLETRRRRLHDVPYDYHRGSAGYRRHADVLLEDLSVIASLANDKSLPLDDGPAPISMSGSSTTMPVWICLPPVPPYSAVSSHFLSASVRRSIGMTLTPML